MNDVFSFSSLELRRYRVVILTPELALKGKHGANYENVYQAKIAAYAIRRNFSTLSDVCLCICAYIYSRISKEFKTNK